MKMRTFLLGLGLSSYEAGKLVSVYGDSSALLELFEASEGRRKLSDLIEPSSVETAHIQFTRIWNGTKVYSSLEPFGVPTEIIYRFFLANGEDEGRCLELLEDNPYRLVFDVDAPFPAVDKTILLFPNYKEEERIKAAVYASLLLAEHGTEDLGTDKLSRRISSLAGSTCLPINVLLDIAGLLLGDDVSPEEILKAARKLHFEKKILLTKKNLNGEVTMVAARSALASNELRAADIINELLTSGKVKYDKNIYEAIDKAQQSLGLFLSHEQSNAVYNALSNRISVITGGPGTGKTQTQKVLLEAFRRLTGGRVNLMAPTGQAAKRMEAATGYPATTIHSALGIFPGETDPRKARNLAADLIVVDEASMVDAQLFAMLLDNIGSAIMVVAGDVDQLPSIGAGNTLAELIKCVPTTRLTKIFRQKKDSADIAYNAARIKAGSAQMIESEKFSFVEADGSAEIQKAVCRVYKEEVAKAGIEDVVVLTPLRRKTKTGVNQLNKALRKVCSDEKVYVKSGDTRIYKNDSIVFLKNRYGLSNGSRGIVTKVGSDSAECVFKDKKITLSGSQLSWIVPAYAETIHKSQGDEYRVVILVADKIHSPTKAMIYTAITRSSGKLIVVGNRQAFMDACKRASGKRYSLLGSLVEEGQA